MLRRVGQVVVRRRVWVLVATVIGFVLSGAIGGNVAENLSSGGFEDTASESYRAERALEKTFGAGQPNLVLLVTAKSGSVDDAAVAARGAALTQDLIAEPTIDQAVSYWTLGSPPPLKSKDGRQALVLGIVDGDEDAVNDAAEHLSETYTIDDAEITVGVGGYGEVFREVGHQIESDLARGEMIAFPITLLLLVLVFGGVVAAGLPLGVGALAIVGTFLALQVVASLTQVSIFALNLTTAMGLGLAIDYSLFVVSRYREELRGGLEPHAAVVRTVETAGRTVAFSAITVAVSLAALLVFPLAFLRSFAYAGIAVVALAGLGAVVALPALLAVLGHRVDKLVLWRHKPKEIGEGFWHRAAVAVMRRPLPIAIAVVLLLLLLGAPFLGIRFGLPDDRVLPASAPARVVHDQIRRNFTSQEANALSVVAVAADKPEARAGNIDTYAADLSRIDGVSRVDAETGTYFDGMKVRPPDLVSAVRFQRAGATWLSVVPDVEAMSPEGEQVVKDVRAMTPPYPVQVTGSSALLVDAKAALFGRMPLAAGLIALVTFTVLFLMFGSLLVPVKAVILNLLSLSATFGAMVWIFQDGNLSGLLDFTPTGTIDTTTPILMFCIAFGLSMDYEVFLLSRIKEEHDRTGDNEASVAIGLERTGRIVTAAAATLAVVFLATATSKVTFIKLFGLGLTMAVLMDATLIRALLVPAFMRLAGTANWWAPAPLRRFHDRFGFTEYEPMVAAPITVAARNGHSDRYIASVLADADACRTKADLRRLLAEEGLTADDLERWRAQEVDRAGSAP